MLKTMAAKNFDPQRPIHLVLDFDATLTVRDTINLLREIPVQRNKRLGHDMRPVPEWSALECAYMQDYNRHKEIEQSLSERQATEHPQSSLAKAAHYSQQLAERKIIEEQSMKRLEDWNFFRGATRRDVYSAAETVLRDGRLEMREHWSDLLRACLSGSAGSNLAEASEVSIISLNWSKTFIRQSLLGALEFEQRDTSELARYINEDLDIHSCEIVGLDDTEGSGGKMRADILSSADKLKYLPQASLRRSPLHPDRTPDPRAPYLVYVGDSATDFDCLMTADTGIWLCPADTVESASEKCREAFKPLKLQLKHIDDVDKRDLAEDELVWAQDFEQITKYLYKLTP